MNIIKTWLVSATSRGGAWRKLIDSVANVLSSLKPQNMPYVNYQCAHLLIQVLLLNVSVVNFICRIWHQCIGLNMHSLKELEHKKLGWKVLNLKSDLGKSLSKEMWCKMADTKTILTTYFKRWKMHVIWGQSFLCPWTRKFLIIMNGILEISWFVHIFLQN